MSELNQVTHVEWRKGQQKQKENQLDFVEKAVCVMTWLAAIVILAMFILTYNKIIEGVIVCIYFMGAISTF